MTPPAPPACLQESLRPFRLYTILALGTLVFVALAWLTTTGFGEASNKALIGVFHTGDEPRQLIGPEWMHEAARDMTALGSISMIVLSTVAVAIWLLLQGQWRTATLMATSVAGGTLASFLLKRGFDHPRPDLLEGGTQVFTSSFPSSHAMASLVCFASLALALGFARARPRALNAWLFSMAAGVSLIAGLSRVYLGVHWPMDVLAGWAAGLAWIALCLLVTRSLFTSWLARETVESGRRQ